MTLPPQLHPPSIQLDPRTYARGLSCVHCGLCLPACPTYTQDFNEADSPRGRIQLMLALSDGMIQPTDSVRQHLDQCLDCRACETACPSGVIYHELIEETRAKLPRNDNPFLRWIFFHVLTHPTRLKLALLPARIARAIGLLNLLPGSLRRMAAMIPRGVPLWPRRLRKAIHAGREPRGAVDLFPTCIGAVMQPDVHRKAADLLVASNFDVHVSPQQVCCGAIHHHNGDVATASRLARRNIDAMRHSRVVTCVAGCGAMLREYGHLLRDDPLYRERAADFSAKVRDISEFLAETGLQPMKHSIPQTVTYHDACHLAHAQRVATAPRMLLSQIPGLKIVPLPESEICCGAAGTYNLTQPQMSRQLADRKLRNIESTGAEVCVTGNVGCAMQIESAARQRGVKLSVVHPVQLLHRAIFGDQR
jgi:glycolate oxidase iron-sulfur subunit